MKTYNPADDEANLGEAMGVQARMDGEMSEDHFMSTTFTLPIHDNLSTKISFEQFKICKVLGRGTFGKVFMVQHEEDGKYYALKALNKDRIFQTLQVEHTKAERKYLYN